MRYLMIMLCALCSVYSSISAAFGLAGAYTGKDQSLIFFDARQVQQWQANATQMDEGFPQDINEHWHGLPTYLDAALYAGANNPHHPNKILLFKDKLYWQWDVTKKHLDSDYPRLIAIDWPGLPDRLDAAVYAPYQQSHRKDKLYFFKGGDYWRWDIETNKMDPGYPKKIAQGWIGLPKGSLDMAVYSGISDDPKASTAHKIFLFQGNQYWRWDLNTDLLDVGYPKFVHQNWPDLRY